MGRKDSYGHAYLTSYGWTGSGTALRKGAIAKPLAIAPKKNLAGVGKDRDEAFPFWDHLFAAASKAITIRVSSDDDGEEDGEEDGETPRTDVDIPLQRTTTGILSNRRPVSCTPASASASTSTSGATTPYPGTGTDTPPNAPTPTPTPTPSLLSTAKREAAKRGLYARFFRGPVLGPDVDGDGNPPAAATGHDPFHHRHEENDEEQGELNPTAPNPTPTKPDREERKRLKKERKERREQRAAKKAEKAAKRAAKAIGKMHSSHDRLDRAERRQNESGSSHRRKRTRVGPESESDGEGDDLARLPSNDVPSKKKKKKKRKDTPP